jgi:hypothetical protein
MNFFATGPCWLPFSRLPSSSSQALKALPGMQWLDPHALWSMSKGR